MSNNKQQPDPLLIDSMAMRYRHDFGLLTSEEQQSIRVTMTQLWEEVVGLGFYKPTQTQMSNNKQSSVEWYIIERHNIEIQSRLGKISPIQYDEQLIKMEEQAKAMQQEQAQLYATFVLKCVQNNLPPVTFNDWINLENNEQQ